LALIVMPFGFTPRSAHHVSTASIARRGVDLRVVRKNRAAVTRLARWATAHPMNKERKTQGSN
jgi:hypothetical protein